MTPPRLLLAALLASLSLPCLATRSLVFCAETAPEGFDPALWDSASTYNVTRQIFQGLVAFKRGGTDVVPSLASKWELSPDGLSYTFHLRKGVSFQTTDYFKPGRQFNADDVIFTVKRWVDPEAPFNRAFKSQLLGPANSGLAQSVQQIEKLDPYTVRIRLKERNATFLTFLAMGFAGMQSAEYADQLMQQHRPSDINQFPVGTGPYQFKSYAKDSAVRFVANPSYWGRPQQTRSLIFAIVTDPQVRIQKLKGNECQLAAAVREADLDGLQADPALKISSTGAMNISYLAFNLKRPQLANRDVRTALDIAIDRDALFKAMFPKGGAIQAINPFPPAVWGWNGRNRNEYNPARARQLLAKAGYSKGFDIVLWALPVQRPTNPNGKLMAQMIQQDWAKIGVKATIQSYEWGEYLRRAGQGEHDVYMSGVTSDSGDPDDFLSTSLSCAVSKQGQRFCNSDFDQLLLKARQTSDRKQRAVFYMQAQEIFKRERPWITIAHSRIYIPMRKNVQGFVMNPNGSFAFEDVYLK